MDLLNTDAGVEETVKDIGDDVDDYQQHTDKEDRTHDNGKVIFVKAVYNDNTHTLPVEDILYKNSTSGGHDGKPHDGKASL